MLAKLEGRNSATSIETSMRNGAKDCFSGAEGSGSGGVEGENGRVQLDCSVGRGD